MGTNVNPQPDLSWQNLTADQIAGARFLASRPVSMLADTMGLGKTAQFVHALDLCGAQHVLVVCPPILRDNVKREFDLWSWWPRTVTVLRTGSDDVPDHGVVCVSYALASSRRMYDKLMQHDWDVLVCDEAHALKTPGALRTAAILGCKRRKLAGIASRSARQIWLTGTPAPNDASELYTFAKTAGVWHGSYSSFISNFCVTVESEHGSKIVGNRNVSELRRLVAPLMLRRVVIDGLPDLHTDVRVCSGSVPDQVLSLTPELLEQIKLAVASEDFQFFDVPAIATIRRLAGAAKCDSVSQAIIAELASGEPCIVAFAQHVEFIARLNAAAKSAGYRVAVLSGATPARKRQLIVDVFQSGELELLICQTQAASEGLTLTRSSRVWIAEPAWTPSVNQQSIARCWRRGQARPVRATYAALSNSIDQTIIDIVARKSKNVAELLD